MCCAAQFIQPLCFKCYILDLQVWPPYRVGGRRGGDPYRRGGHGNFRKRGRGRGLGRGTSSHFTQQDATSATHPASSAAEAVKSTEEVAGPSETEKGSAAPMQPQTRALWCELCRVECNSMEILEQHKNGKKHKKNLQKSESINSINQAAAKVQSDERGVHDANPEEKLQPENAQEGEENKKGLPEKVPTESVTEENKAEVENPGCVQAGLHQFDNHRRGMKRKMRGGRGGKQMRTLDGLRRLIKRAQPKVVIPLICDLCNIKCDTQEVFNRHVSGKKHISKLKRFEGHQAMYGPLGLQALYPPNPIAQTLHQAQGPQQTFDSQQVSYPPPGDHITPPAHPAEHVPASLASGSQQNPNHSSSDGNPDTGVQKAPQHLASVEPAN